MAVSPIEVVRKVDGSEKTVAYRETHCLCRYRETYMSQENRDSKGLHEGGFTCHICSCKENNVVFCADCQIIRNWLLQHRMVCSFKLHHVFVCRKNLCLDISFLLCSSCYRDIYVHVIDIIEDFMNLFVVLISEKVVKECSLVLGKVFDSLCLENRSELLAADDLTDLMQFCSH